MKRNRGNDSAEQEKGGLYTRLFFRFLPPAAALAVLVGLLSYREDLSGHTSPVVHDSVVEVGGHHEEGSSLTSTTELDFHGGLDSEPLRHPDDPRSVSGLLLLEPEDLRGVVSQPKDDRELQAAIWCMGNNQELSNEDVSLLLNVLDRSKDPQVLKTALWVLSLRQDLLPVAAVSAFALAHEADEVRLSAIRTLGIRNDADSAGTLLTTARNDRAPQNRQESIFYLSFRLPESDAVSTAVDALKYEKDTAVRTGWISMIAAQDTDESRSILSAVLQDESESLEARRLAGENLAAVHPDEAREILARGRISSELREKMRKILDAGITLVTEED
jgi:hypothetical protein